MTHLPGLSVRRSLMSLACLALMSPMRSSVQSGTGMACKYQCFLYFKKKTPTFLGEKKQASIYFQFLLGVKDMRSFPLLLLKRQFPMTTAASTSSTSYPCLPLKRQLKKKRRKKTTRVKHSLRYRAWRSLRSEMW